MLTAFQGLLDMTDTLKEADDRWRAANPAKAARIPFDALVRSLQTFSNPTSMRGAEAVAPDYERAGYRRPFFMSPCRVHVASSCRHSVTIIENK